jgi:hypothetical protein
VEFQQTRKDKKCCTQPCSSTYSARKNAVKRKEEKKNLIQPRRIDEDREKLCNVCEVVKPIEEFYFNKGSRYKQCRSCVYNKSRARYVRKMRELNGIDKTLLIDLESFLMSMKRKRFMANEVDIFKLIDMYDRVFPTGLIPVSDDPELTFNKMLYKLAIHYRVEKTSVDIP